MERKVPLINNELFHIYNRGVDKRKTFLDIHDYHRFIMLLYLCNSTQPVDMQKVFREGRTFTDIFSIDRGDKLVDIGCWALMPNHFHLVMRPVREGGVTKYMRKLSTGYSIYFNQKYQRSGSLFQGKFKSEHIDNDVYLKYIFSYVHLNPLKIIPGEEYWKDVGINNMYKADNFINQYEYSSFPDYLKDNRIYRSIINKDIFSESTDDFLTMIDDVKEWTSLPN